MNEKLITFETAKLARDKEFNQSPTKLNRDYYNHLGEFKGDVTDYLKAYFKKEDTSKFETIDAPTQSLLQNWLRDKYNININIKHRTHSQTYCFDITGDYNKENEGILISNTYVKYEKYEDALEVALQLSLNLIKK